MNKQIRAVAFTLLLMFGAVFLNLNWIQLVRAESLANHPRNTRLLLKEYALERGAILSAERQILAQSIPTPNETLKSLRTYPTRELFGHEVGYYSLRFGRDGLERTYNRQLTGRGGVVTMQDLGDRLLGEGQKGDTLVLSIDSRVQRAAMDALGGRKGAVVALEPSTGQILAMAAQPSFDPNPLSQHSSRGQEEAWTRLQNDPNRPMLNRATNATYPPGSTFKLITAAAALRSGMSTNTSFPASAGYQAPQTDRVIRNFGGGTCGGDMVEAMTVSCNAYFARLGAELPRGALEETAKAFGFTEPPPLDIRASASKLPTSEQLASPAFAALSSIGQFNVAAAPLQMALVAAGIANGGKVPVPRLVRQIEDARGGVVEQSRGEVWKDAISPDIAATLTQMMIGVVEGGTATRAAIPGVRVAAKTGTAQAGATGDDTLSWTVAFAPADSPRIAVAVAVESAESAANETGGRIAAPIVKTVLEAHRAVARW
ncbi:MAG: penicillin-binding transpeptidase domain-containing protein [Actinomycetota bacterium]|nr:penicillin-binding transpeptidase domain-containing protein [Actinomycetota bacterium]